MKTLERFQIDTEIMEFAEVDDIEMAAEKPQKRGEILFLGYLALARLNGLPEDEWITEVEEIAADLGVSAEGYNM